MYCTEPTLIERYGASEMAAWQLDRGTPSPERLARAIADATAEIDDALRVRYRLPLAEVPASIERVACQISRYRLSVAAGKTTELIAEEYAQAISWLRRVARGEVDPGIAAQAESATVPGRASFSGQPRRFSRSTLEGY